MINLKKVNTSFELATARCNYFNEVYKDINIFMVEKGSSQISRAGNTREIFDFKLTIENPIKRCVGGDGRNINIFFLLAEAMWIFNGRRDVEFLEIFNSRMSNYSDDGKSFHASYGYRLRNYLGRNSEHLDQVELGLEMLKNNKEDRRCVMSIWDPVLDLSKTFKDIPCNDLLMFKIREGKLNLTVQNRSNDLHWGLPTNVFQFSFLLEIFSEILDVEIGTQTHNSQSLHYYLDNNIGVDMYFETKYRRKVFTEAVEQTLKEVCLGIEQRYEINFLEIGADTDHVHFLIQTIPNKTFSEVVTTIKSITARQIFKLHPEVKTLLWGGNLWTAGYYANTVGQYGNLKMLTNYVKNQKIPNYKQILSQ